MYISERTQAHPPTLVTRLLTRPFAVDRNVVLLGLTSMFTDVSSEMVSAVVPLYLTFVLGFNALQFGILDGAYQGVSALLRVLSGVLADRRRLHKEVAATGYGLSAACKLGLLGAGTAWLPAVGCLLLDRVGKGIRTAPRDALISLSSSPAQLAEAFGVHRTLDTAGALLGPVLAFALLAVAPGRFDAVFLTSFCVALIGLGVLLFFVQNRATGARGIGLSLETTPSVAARPFESPAFRRIVVAATALALVTISDAFIYLHFQRRSDLGVRFFPLLYVGTALVYLLLALPAGRLADRVGRRLVFLGGHVALLGVYASLLVPSPGTSVLVGCLVLLGAYYAATDGVLMAFTTATLPRSQLASGFALLTTMTSLARFAAAVLFGALWSARGPDQAAAAFVVSLAAATALAVTLLPRRLEPST